MKATFRWNNHDTKESERFYHGAQPDEARTTAATFLVANESEANLVLEVLKVVLSSECPCRKATMEIEE